MKPSDIILSTPPLTACFKKTESEWAAALLVLYCQKHGDKWQAVTPQQLGHSMVDTTRGAPEELGSQSVLHPNQPVSFTELGLEKLRNSNWNRNRL